MGQKAKNAGKKQSKTCDKPVSSYAEINKLTNSTIKRFTTVNNYTELELFTVGSSELGEKEHLSNCPLLKESYLKRQ